LDFFDLLKTKYNISLNDQQKAAVTHVNGSALVLAGPGSGKTTVITARTAYLCLEIGINPKNILTMTFGRLSTSDMKTRFDRLFGQEVTEKVRFSTLHSFCNRVLHDYERRQGQRFRLIESDEEEESKQQILRGIYQEINQLKINDDELETLISEIGLVKNRMIKDLELVESFTTTKNIKLIYQAYESYKKENLYMDYDDMLTYAYVILRKCPDILEYYKKLYQFIQIDEGQDLSKIQFEILNLLVDQNKQNLFIVADDDQSIYAFRGAEPEYILNIKDRYDNCNIFKLETNYRSSKNIVEISSRFIKKNMRRFDKNHNTNNEGATDPVIIGVENESEQTSLLLLKIAQIKSESPDSSIAVIYRNNLSSLAIVDALERQNINFKIRQNRLHFFSNWSVQDIISILRFATDQTDVESFERVYYKIKRYISKAMMEFAKKTYYKESFVNAILEFPNLQQFQIRNLVELKNEFKKLCQLKPDDALNYIEEQFKYDEYRHDFCEKTRISYTYASNIFGILKCIASCCETVPDFLKRISDLNDLLQSKELLSRKSNVTLTTMHSSKGLEFDCVFMVDLTNDEIPGIEIKETEIDPLIEEERRLFYVGMTRARKNLFLIYPQHKGDVPQPRSVFINEVATCFGGEKNKSTGEIVEGTLISHRKFGYGIVESIHKQSNNLIVKVSFQGERKTLDYTICKQNGLISIVN
jgi:DNA helicase-2/ATP-dependent DNA helicase PcrA